MSENNIKLHEKRWFFPALITLFAIILYIIPHDATESMMTHQAIVDALLAGNNWGRQALVGNTDCPALQTLALLITQAILGMLHLALSPQRLLVALSQATVMAYMVRILMQHKKIYLALIPVTAALLFPITRYAFTSLDPNWIVAIPAAAAIYHIAAWNDGKSMRDLTMAAIFNGILCICGPTPAIISIAVAVIFYLAVRKELSTNNEPYYGMRSLLWAPAVYCLALWFLWNWLVMDNVLFGLSDLFARLNCTRNDISAMFNLTPISAISIAFMAPLIIICLKANKTMSAKCLIPFFAVTAIIAAISHALQFYAAALVPMVTTAILAAFTLCAMSDFCNSVPRKCCLMALICCAYLCFRAEHLAHGVQWDTTEQAVEQAPSREEITSFIDQYWPKSRTMLYGLRLPALYPDTTEERFVARLDFQENDLLAQATQEQLHLLVPPPTGEYYPRKGHTLADIHDNGKPWLLLEHEWPGGWQLWRVVIAPEKESKLDILR